MELSGRLRGLPPSPRRCPFALLVVIAAQLLPSRHLRAAAAFCPGPSAGGGSATGRTSYTLDNVLVQRAMTRSRAEWVKMVQRPSVEGEVRQQQQQQPTTTSEGGSVLGAALLFAGTAIGAGMLALPAEAAPAGFVPSVSTLLLCWAFTFVTSLVTLEASWSVGRRNGNTQKIVGDEDEESESGGGAGFLSITRTALGPVGEIVTALLFWFLLTSIIVAYTSEGGELVSQAVAEYSESSLQISPAIGSGAFMAFFSSLAIFGTSRVDLVNRVLVAGFVGAFLGLVGVGLPQISTDLLSHADWGAVYPTVVSVGILSFGAQNVVPTLLQYLDGDAVRTRRAILIGSLIPLAMYSLWEAVFLGTVPFDADAGGSKMQVVTALGESGGTVVQELVEVFSACSIGSSMAGASVSLVDFFQDAITSRWSGTTSEGESPPSTTMGPGLGGRLVAAALALGPPLGLACAYPDAFLGALENAGLIGGVTLYGVLPALAVVNLRSSLLWEDKESVSGVQSADVGGKREIMPGRVMGGTAALYAIVAVSAALVLPDLVGLGGDLLH